jgi:hypothetical protein
MQPLLEYLPNERLTAGSRQLPGSFLATHVEPCSPQSFGGQCCGLRTGAAGTSLMIIEGIQEPLIIWMGRHYPERPGDRQAKQRGHPVVDHRAAHCVELRHWQHVKQRGTGDELPASVAASEQPRECLDAVINDHRIVGQWQRSTDERIVIKMNPALSKRQLRRQPALIGAGSGTKINDLHSVLMITGYGQVLDQIGHQGVQGGGTCGGVCGDPGGEPVRVDGACSTRSR